MAALLVRPTALDLIRAALVVGWGLVRGPDLDLVTDLDWGLVLDLDLGLVLDLDLDPVRVLVLGPAMVRVPITGRVLDLRPARRALLALLRLLIILLSRGIFGNNPCAIFLSSKLKNISMKGPRNRRSLGFARDDKERATVR